MYGSIYMKCPKLTERQKVEWFPGERRDDGVGG